MTRTLSIFSQLVLHLIDFEFFKINSKIFSAAAAILGFLALLPFLLLLLPGALNPLNNRRSWSWRTNTFWGVISCHVSGSSFSESSYFSIHDFSLSRVGEDDIGPETRPVQFIAKPEFYVRTVYDW